MKLKSPHVFILASLIFLSLAGYLIGLHNLSWNDLKINFLRWRLSNSVISERYQMVKEISKLTSAEEALSIIYHSGLPIDGELHLLSHIVGETLYKKKGASALLDCRSDQLYGCTHGLLISAMTNEGFEVVKASVNACQNESEYQYWMCLHAAGHGFLAYTNYEIEPALQYCDAIGGESQTLNHCYVGVFMENVHGSHDGKPAYTHPSLSVNNPDSPCDTVDKQYKSACYLNQVGWWVQIFEGNYQRVGQYCTEIPKDYQVECANNLGRVLSTAFQDKVDVIRDNCYSITAELSAHCLAGVATSMAGMSAHEKAIDFCKSINDKDARLTCDNSVLEVWRAQGLLNKPNLQL